MTRSSKVSKLSSVSHRESWYNSYQVDGKETRAAIQQAADEVNQVKVCQLLSALLLDVRA